MPLIQFKNSTLSFRLRRSKRAKRLSLVYKAPSFEVVAPMGLSSLSVQDFVKAQLPWMHKVHAKHPCKQPQAGIQWPEQFLSGEKILFRGAHLGLNLKFSTQASVQCSKTLTLSVPPTHVAQDLGKHVKAHLLAWYHAQAERLVQRTLEQHCPILKRWPNGYRLKAQKTRWGSCGVNNQLNINWLLVLAPEGMLEYVVVHELCHLFHRNHGKRFWTKVATCMPDYKRYDKWLNTNGQAFLMSNPFVK